MIEKIKELEKISRQLEPASEQRTQWNTALHNYAEKFLEHNETVPTYITTEDKGKGILAHPISEDPASLDTLLELFENHVDRPGLNPASHGHLGYIPGGGIYPAAMGDFLAAITNRFSGVFFASPGAVRIENQLIRWMSELIGYPTTAAGNLTSGGSIANLIAIATARDAKGLKAADFHRAVIYLSGQAHHSVARAIRIAGLGESIVRFVPVDDHFRMNSNELETMINQDRNDGLLPFLVVANAGTTDTGAMDPLDIIGDIAQQQDLWYHIDAAYGGFFIMCDETKELFKGMEKSDSVVIDPHKGLFLPYGLGTVLVKNEQHLRETFHYYANYMQDVVDDAYEPSPADYSPELSKHFRGLRLWLPLHLFGVRPFRAALSEKIWLARYFHQEIGSWEGFEVGPTPDLSVAIFRYVPKTGDANVFNEQLTEAMQQDGRVFLSSTTIDGTFFIRLAVLSFRTHKHTIDLCLQMIRENVDKLTQR